MQSSPSFPSIKHSPPRPFPAIAAVALPIAVSAVGLPPPLLIAPRVPAPALPVPTVPALVGGGRASAALLLLLLLLPVPPNRGSTATLSPSLALPGMKPHKDGVLRRWKPVARRGRGAELRWYTRSVHAQAGPRRKPQQRRGAQRRLFPFQTKKNKTKTITGVAKNIEGHHPLLQRQRLRKHLPDTRPAKKLQQNTTTPACLPAMPKKLGTVLQ